MSADRKRLEPRREPRQARSRDTVEAVLEAAAQVFELHGYASGTTNRIAERAGVSIGSLYQYFSSKDAILVALMSRHLDESDALLRPLAEQFVAAPPPVLVGLQQLVEALVSLHEAAPRLHRVLFEECPRPLAIRRRLDDAYDRAVHVIAHWLAARPEVRVADPRLAAELVVQTVEGATHRLVIRPAPGRRSEQYAAEVVELLHRYLSASPSP